MIKREKVKSLLSTNEFDREVTVMGWVRTFRNNQFIAINDGSCIGNIQVVVDFNNTPEELLKRITTGAAISVKGKIV
jgi:asparaginyl-tRNA synthetase